MSADPTIPLLRKLLAFSQTKEVIDFFGRMEERIVRESMDVNSPTSPTAVQENVDYCSLPFHERHQLAAAVLKMSREETSGSPFTRAKTRAHRVRMAGPPREEKLVPRMYRRFLKSRSTELGRKETARAVNLVGAGDRRELGFTTVVTHDQVPESMLEEGEDGSGLDVNLNLAITMHAQSTVAASTALSDHILESADTSHDFSFPAGIPSDSNEGWFSYPEDFLQLACIPVCAKNLGPGGGYGNPLAAGCSESSGTGICTIRNNGKSPEIFMERRPADRSNVPANALSPVTCRQTTDTTACPVDFRWNTAETLLNSCRAEMSLNNLASTRPGNSRNLTRKQRATGRQFFHVKPSSSKLKEPTFHNLLTACTELTGDSQMNEPEFWQQRGRQGNRRGRLQPDLMNGRQYYPIPSTERAAASGTAEGIGDQELELNLKFLETMRVLQDMRGNSFLDEKAFEIHISEAERDLALADKNVFESHRRFFPSEDAHVRRQEKEHGVGAPEFGPGDREDLIDVNRVPDEGEERQPEMKKCVQMLGQLHASERRCQSLLVDNHHLRQLNFSLKDQMIQLAQNYKSMISENSSLLEKLRTCRNHELDRILDTCSKLG